MEMLAEKVLTGKWRSYKIFKRSGGIQLHTERQFQEFDFMCDRVLSIKRHEGNSMQTLAQTDQWCLSFEKKKHFLSIPAPKLLYEIITVNHTVLVLLEITSGEKIFFAKDHHWKEYLKTNRSIII
jgi:hypothetical protein